ncbi:MAG TPA: hypothetical protein VGG19_01970 [Tepidisphaeraceae bacterium]|jgi:hypothetical protein
MLFNSVAYAQFRLHGGVRGILVAAGAYFAALALGVGIVYSSTETRYRIDTFSELADGLIALQVLMYLFVGMQSMSTAVEGDKSSNMIESHRMTPISAGNAVLGYLGGGPCQAYAFFMVNCLLGVLLYVLEPRIRMTLSEAVLINCVLFVFGMFLFSLIICWGLAGRKVARYVIGIIILAWISGGQVFTYVPGMSFLVSPVLWVERWMQPPDWVFAMAMGAQVAVGAILLIAGARKYRYPNLPAFTATLGLIFIAIMTMVSGLAIHVWQNMSRYSYGWGTSVDMLSQFSCSILMLAWLGMVPVLAAIRQPQPRMNPVLVGILSACISCGLMAVVPDQHWQILLIIAAIVLVFELTMVYLLRFFESWTPKAPMLSFALLAIYSGGPFILDAFRYSENGGQRWTTLATISPMGALLLVWDKHYSVTAGLVVQVVVLAGVIALYYLARRGKSSGALPGSSPMLSQSA